MTGDADATSRLTVRLGGTPVGVLDRLPDDRVAFAFDPGYATDPARPILGLAFEGAVGGLVTPRPSRAALPAWFSNLLPEGHLRDYLAARAGVKPVREFFLLEALGQDLPGAVTATAESGPHIPTGRMDESDATATPLRFSLAGVQLKFSALAAADGGLTIPATGAGGDWIVKLPSARFAEVPTHEAAMLDLAESVGIEVPPHHLVPLEAIGRLPVDIGALSGSALAVERFDRGPEGRIHTEDFAQVFALRPHDKYGRASCEDIGRVVVAEAGFAAGMELVRRLAFAVLTGNADAHVKNWSLRYPTPRRVELAPAYDLVGTVAFLPDASLALSLGGARMMAEVDLARFARFAARVGLPRAAVEDEVLASIRRLRTAWRGHPAVGTLPTAQRRALEQHALTVPLWRER